MTTFGDKLRRQRELLGISLETISNSTKIGTRMLRAIEDEHFDQLPGGVFNKGFVRAYARCVKLDEEEAVTGYLEALRESQIQAQAILPNFRPIETKSNAAKLEPAPPAQSEEISAPPAHPAGFIVPWKKFALPALAALALVGFFAVRHRHLASTATVRGAASPSAGAARPAALALGAAQPQPPSTTGSSGNASSSPGSFKPARNPGKVAAPSHFTLLIRATENSWISIAADGEPVARETLIAPAHTSVRASHEVVVKAGNAAGISFVLNGKEIPATGGAGEVRTYTFDASGLRPAAVDSAAATLN